MNVSDDRTILATGALGGNTDVNRPHRLHECSADSCASTVQCILEHTILFPSAQGTHTGSNGPLPLRHLGLCSAMFTAKLAEHVQRDLREQVDIEE